MEEPITYEEAVARVADDLAKRFNAVTSLPRRNVQDGVLAAMQMERIVADKKSYSEAVAVVFGKDADDVYGDVTDDLKEKTGDGE